MSNKEETFVLENTEVRLTGRTASKPSISNNKADLELVEVIPANEYDGLKKRWVARNMLFIIKEPNT